ncbi:hypothetical protein [Asanoa iriomotensis]|uniref:Galactose oxidase n=1 Tax=Asanoa iriomotensis TaxID=234613 RepID=A0ABQ4C427_9ACTN|nr:hypothetical protein [Asanoa iriomotensis]GIF57509.1 hypothetical protein Air01nite_36040 [Asanoa iriomotensis]
MRKVALALAVVLLLSGCTGEGTTAGPAEPSGASPTPTVITAPPPVWRLATLPELRGPSNVLWDVASVDATHAWAVGREAYSPEKPDDTGVPLVLEWDGTRWDRAALPQIGWYGGFELVAADSPANVWVVGNKAAPTPEDQEAHVFHFDGTAWREVSLPRRVNEDYSLITGLTVGNGQTWLVGNHQSDVVIEQWDGTGWRAHQSPAECRSGGTSFGGMPNFCTFTAIKAFGPNDVWAAGNGAWKGFKGPLLFHWNGSGWRTVQVGINEQETSFNALGGRSSAELWAVGDHGLAVRGAAGSFDVLRDAPGGLLPDVATDPAGRPWLIENTTAPSTGLAAFSAGAWVGQPAPQPPDAIGMSLHGITGTPGSSLMFAAGHAALPTEPRYVRAVLLEYVLGPGTESRA